MSTFLLNPYDATLNLADKDDRKLFQEGSKGLKDKDIFDGKKVNYGNFVKLIERELNATRTMEALEICTEWNKGATTAEGKRIPLKDNTVNIFKSNKATSDEVKAHCNLVWSSSKFGTETPTYFKIFIKAPTDTHELETERNARKLKHVMMGNKLWDSLSSGFKIEITGSKDEFQREQENDGPLLWDFIRRRINPTTTVGASKLKDEIEAKRPIEFDNDIVKYNTWFEDTRDKIIKEEGDGYNEYLRSMFRAYLSCSDTEFVDAIKDERRKWTQGKLGSTYSYRELMDLGRLTFNNLLEEGTWNGGGTTKGKELAERNYLALATELMGKMKEMTQKSGSNYQKQPATDKQNEGARSYMPWRFENPDNKPTKILKNGVTMKWCSKDCHEKPMWCGRRNCLGRADFNAAWKKNKAAVDSSAGSDSNSDFKIALAAMTSPEDFAALQDQFKSLKD